VVSAVAAEVDSAVALTPLAEEAMVLLVALAAQSGRNFAALQHLMWRYTQQLRHQFLLSQLD
jgi:hypothetical protein